MTSRFTAHRSAIKLDFSISHDWNSVLILCIIQVAVFFGQGSRKVVLPCTANGSDYHGLLQLLDHGYIMVTSSLQ